MQSFLMGGCGCGICHDVELNVIGTLAKLYGSRARWAPKKKWAREKKGVTFAEEIAKAMGVLLIFRLLRAEFDAAPDCAAKVEDRLGAPQLSALRILVNTSIGSPGHC